MSSDRRRRSPVAPSLLLLGFTGLAPFGCSTPSAPAKPTWADVQPIVAGQCTHCHGATASTTGLGYRFDFFDMSLDVCGDASQVLGPNAMLAKGLATLIANAITSDKSDVRPRMPPVPAQYLAEWEWTTILRWAADPQRGVKGRGAKINHPPTLTINGTGETADKVLDVTVVVADADGDPVVGVLKIGDEVLKMDRSGSFSARLDTAAWPAGQRPVSAVLCDGWSNVTQELGVVEIKHAGGNPAPVDAGMPDGNDVTDAAPDQASSPDARDGANAAETPDAAGDRG